MEMQEFIRNFGNQFDDANVDKFTPETKFREEDEWTSLTALAVLNMIAKKYGISLKADEMQKTNTIQELFDLVSSKK